MAIYNKNIFTGGMDSDTEERLIAPGDYRYAISCRVGSSDNDNIFAVENVKGNTIVSIPIPAGLNKCIGAFQDITNQKIYYFVWNQQSNHQIYEFDSVTNTITTILQNIILNFDQDHLITGVNLIEGLLYWTDDFNEPAKLNIEKAKKHTAGDFVNGYPFPFRFDYLHRVKDPPMCEPDIVYGSDSTKNYNYLDEKVFQFKYRYIYDDNEKSATSPISVIVTPQGACGTAFANGLNNKLDIIVETGTPIVKRIEIFARELNTGDFFSIVDLDKKELCIGDDTTYTYSFYNEGLYQNLEINESIKLYDNVPLKSKAQEIIEGNRLVDGNILEGYDPVEVDASLCVKVQPQQQIKRYSFSGYVVIRNPLALGFVPGAIIPLPGLNRGNFESYQLHQPIHREGGGTPMFGGFTPVLTGVVDNVGSKYKQEIPLGGFVHYLAGTNHYAVSQQLIGIPDSTPQFALSPWQIYGGNVPVPNYNPTNRQTIQGQIEGGGGTSLLFLPDGNTDGPATFVFSVYNFTDVAPGKYVMRVASHLTTQADLDSGNLNYQKTSTNTIAVANQQGGEATIEIKDNGDLYVNGAFVGNSARYVGLTEVMDLTMPIAVNRSATTALGGYVIDRDNASLAGSNIFYDTHVELALVKLKVGTTSNLFSIFSFFTSGGFISLLANAAAYVINWSNNKFYTDHNGYFFATFPLPAFSGQDVSVDSIRSVDTGMSFGAFDLAGLPFSNPVNEEGKIGIFRASTSNQLNSVRTKMNGKITYLGTGISAGFVITTKGGFVGADTNGNYSLIVYGDTITYDATFTKERSDILISALAGASCFGTFNNDDDIYSIGFFIPLGQYDLNAPYTGNYDYTSMNVKTTGFTLASLLSSNNAEKTWKAGGIYQYGVVYYDHANRSGTTNTFVTSEKLCTTYIPNACFTDGLKAYVPFFTDKDASGNTIGGGRRVIDWTLSNRPPIWASHYQWVRTKNNTINRYLQWEAKTVEYVNSDGTPSVSNSADFVVFDISNIFDETQDSYKKRNPDSQISYEFAEGDRVRLIKDVNSIYYSQYVDMKIVKAETSGTSYRLFCDNDTSIAALSNGLTIEIYTPKRVGQEDIYWEFGECLEIGDATLSTRYHKGETTDQLQPSVSDASILDNLEAQIAAAQAAGNSALVALLKAQYVTLVATYLGSATGVFEGGDAYLRLRTVPYLAPASTTYIVTTQLIEDASISDFYTSKVEDIGRPNRVDKDFKQVRRPTTIYYSEKFIPETNINGLSSVFDISFETYNRVYDSIQKLYSDDHYLYVFQELKCGNIPISQQIIYDNAGQSVVGTSAKVLNNIQYYDGEYGIAQQPESFAVYGKQKYFTDYHRGAVLRLSIDGLTPISEYKMHNFFTDSFAAIEKTGQRAKIYGTFDIKFNEYILAIEDISYSSSVLRGFTIAFNERNNRWSSFYPYKPEFMSMNNTGIVTFKDGFLYLHNDSLIYNNFYGNQFNSEIHLVMNPDPSKKKVWQAISEETTDIWEVPSLTTPGGQETDLSIPDFENIEGNFYASILFDKNTPNVSNPIIEGDPIRDYAILVKLRNSNTNFVKLYAINCIYANSERSNK